MAERAVVALTDRRWLEFLRRIAVDGRLDEVNFWRPLAQGEFRSLSTGEPFFFRLKNPVNAIAGYGFFATATRLPIRMAWEAFGERNGDPTFEALAARIAEYRHETPLETVLGTRELTCLILREVHFFSEPNWLPWGEGHDFRKQIVAYKAYDLGSADGAVLRALLQNHRPAELAPTFVPLQWDERLKAEQLVAVREGQGSFRVRVLDAYSRRCAVTGEHTLPVLDAAHIQPYLGPGSNHVQNGLSLRADIHRLYDAGYVTVTPEHRFEVSARLKHDFDNGQVYYQIDGRPLAVVPSDPKNRPSLQALEWHASNVFR
jgi:putative restriction endonuclease